MTESLHQKRPRATWILLLGAAFICYFLSVPLVELSPLTRGLPARIKIHYQEPWNWLYLNTPLDRPLLAYENFWRRYFQAGELAPGFGKTPMYAPRK